MDKRRRDVNPKEFSSKDIKKLFSLIDKTSGYGPNGDCWVLSDKPNRTWYPLFETNIGKFQASRIIFAVKSSLIVPADLEICHKCDFKPCVRYSHLFMGTHKDNMRHAASNGRIGNAVLTLDEINEVRELYKHRKDKRRCIRHRYFKLYAKEFGVRKEIIKNIVLKRTFKKFDPDSPSEQKIWIQSIYQPKHY